MAGFRRIKQVTDPLDDKVKDRIIGGERRQPVYFSSGSEHSGRYSFDSSPCFSNLLNNFLDEDAEADFPVNETFTEQKIDSHQEINKTTIFNVKPDPFRNVLLSRVMQAIHVFSYLKSTKSVLRRNVMAFLRNTGYNAAICKTKWEKSSSGTLIAGKHEFIDVIRSDTSTRYFIELDFIGEFEIARPTDQYDRLLRTLPTIFVGSSDELKDIVKVMTDEAKRSLKSRELHLPPWRKNRYMQNKWFGPYRRTVNLVQENMTTPFVMTVKPKINVKCRSVGFNAVNGRSFLHGSNNEIK